MPCAERIMHYGSSLMMTDCKCSYPQLTSLRSCIVSSCESFPAGGMRFILSTQNGSFSWQSESRPRALTSINSLISLMSSGSKSSLSVLSTSMSSRMARNDCWQPRKSSLWSRGIGWVAVVLPGRTPSAMGGKASLEAPSILSDC